MASVRPAWRRAGNVTGGRMIYYCPSCHEPLGIEAWSPGSVLVAHGWHPSGPRRRTRFALGPDEVMVYSKPRNRNPASYSGGMWETPFLARCRDRDCGEICRIDNPHGIADSNG